MVYTVCMKKKGTTPRGRPTVGEGESTRIHVTVDLATLEKFDRRAKRERLTRSQLTRRAIDAYLAENGRTTTDSSKSPTAPDSRS